MSDGGKSDVFKDIEDQEYMVSGEVVLAIVRSLLELVVTFIGVSQAKAILTTLEVEEVNEKVDALERAKFGN